MKDNLLVFIMTLVLVLGIWSLSVRPVKANIPCLVTCVNEYASCIVDVKAFCGSSLGCTTIGATACKVIKRQCERNCGPCPI